MADRTHLDATLTALVSDGAGVATDVHARKTASLDVAPLFIDLDRFNAVNDRLGYIAGDNLLRAVGGRLRSALREQDLPVRLGGDEFAFVLLAPLDHEIVSNVAVRLVELLARPYLVNGSIAKVGASIGISVARLEDGTDGATLLRYADLAMYQAKADGRGRYCFFKPALRDRAEARRLLEFDFRAALALGQFELFYQLKLI